MGMGMGMGIMRMGMGRWKLMRYMIVGRQLWNWN